MEIKSKYIFFLILGFILKKILLKPCWCCIKLVSDTLLNALSEYFLWGECINLSAAASLFTHSKGTASLNLPGQEQKGDPCGSHHPDPLAPAASRWLDLPVVPWWGRGGAEELPGVFGHGMSASQTGASLLAFGFIYFRVINNRELLSNPNLDSLWKCRSKILGRVCGFCPSTCYSRGWRISSQDGGLPLCPAGSPLWLQPPGLAALPLPWEPCPSAWQNAKKCFAEFFFSHFPQLSSFNRNSMNLHDKTISKAYRALLVFGLGSSRKLPGIL